MRIVFVLAITIPVLLAFGVACGGDEEEARLAPSPASESEGEAEEAEEWEEEEWEAEEAEAEEAWDEGEAEEGEAPVEGVELCDDFDMDGVCDVFDLCVGTAAGDVVDDVGCSDAQVDGDGDGVCERGAPSDGPSDCALPG